MSKNLIDEVKAAVVCLLSFMSLLELIFKIDVRYLESYTIQLRKPTYKLIIFHGYKLIIDVLKQCNIHILYIYISNQVTKIFQKIDFDVYRIRSLL